MKIIIFDDNLRVKSVVQNVYGITKKDVDSLEWSNGMMSNLSDNYTIQNDEFEIIIGNEIDLSIVLPQIKEIYKSRVNNNVNNACFKGFVSGITGWGYETEYHDQTNFSRRMLTLLNDQDKTTVKWKTADGVVREHTREQFLGVCNELDEFITSKVNAGWIIKNIDIENASTLEELKSINLEVE